MNVILEKIGLIILAGGKSSRMGQDKGLMEWQGKPLIQGIIERSLQIDFAERVIVTNKPEDYRGFGVAVTTDIYSHLGPMSGIHAGLQFNQAPYQLVVACDMPFIDFTVALALLPYLNEDNQAIVPSQEGKHQPLLAFYHRDCAPVIEQMLLVEDERKLTKLFSRIPTQFVEMNVEQRCFSNVNTPQQFSEAYLLEAQSERNTPIVSIVASQSGTGKTTFLRQLIPELTRLGLRVAVVKSDGHGFQLDQEGKDTWHFTQAGAQAVAIVAPDQYAIIQKTSEKADLLTVAKMIGNVDLVIIESRSRGITPILEIARRGVTQALITAPEKLMAVITDMPEQYPEQRYLPLEQPNVVARYILEELLPK